VLTLTWNSWLSKINIKLFSPFLLSFVKTMICSVHTMSSLYTKIYLSNKLVLFLSFTILFYNNTLFYVLVFQCLLLSLFVYFCFFEQNKNLWVNNMRYLELKGSLIALIFKTHWDKDLFFASSANRFKDMFFFSNCVYRFGKYLSHGVFAIGSNENSNALVTTRTSHLILIHLFASKHFIW